MIKKYLALGMLLTWMTPAFAQSPAEGAKELSLREAVSYALEHSEDISKSSYEEQIAKQMVRETKSTGLPQLNATTTLDYFPALPTQILPGALAGQENDIAVRFGKDYNAQAGLEATQLLFNKSYFVGLEAVKSTEDLYRLRSQMTKEDVIYNVSTAFFQVLQTKEQFENIKANLNKLEQLEKILTLQYKNDLVKKVDVTKIKVNRTNLENQQKTLTTIYEQQLNMLKFFMGMPLEQQIALEKSTVELAAVAALTAQDVDASNMTQYQLLQKQKELTQLQAKNIRAGYYPTLSAYGRYGYQTQRNDLFSDETPWFKTSVVGVRLSIPIFDGFKKDAQIKQAELEQQKLDADIQKFNKNVAVQLTNAISQLGNSQSAIAAQEENVELAQEVYDTTNKLYKEGLAPLSDLLDAEVSLREAMTNLNNEKLKYQIAQLNYLKANGNLETLTK